MAPSPELPGAASRPRLAGLLLVLLIHLLAAWLLIAQLRRPAAPPQLKTGPITLSLQRLPEQPMPPIKPAAPVRLPQEAADTSLNDTQPDTSPEPAPVVSTITPTRASAGPAALNLALPPQPASSPERWRNPALSDPRANTLRPDAGLRMAAALGSDARLHEESLGDGRHRFRQGGKCVQTSEQRIQQLDPYNASMSAAPRLLGSCD